MQKNFISYFLFLKLISFSLNIQVDEDNIENCDTYSGCKDINNCQPGEIKKCEICKDKYFSLFGFTCEACDDKNYGNIGCGGKCDGSNYINTRNVMCEKEGCKEGFYNVDGICFNCSETSYNCSKCSYTGKNDFKCLDCLNKRFFQLDKKGKCIGCKMNNCVSCHFDIYNSSDSSDSSDSIDYNDLNGLIEQYNFVDKIYVPVCDKCKRGYYLHPKLKICVICHNVPIDGGMCEVCKEKNVKINFKCSECFQFFFDEKHNKICSFCKDNYINRTIECSCDDGYTLIDPYICDPCPQHCKICNYDNITQQKECIKCKDGFTLVKGVCQKCCENCNNCSYIGGGNGGGGTLRCNKCESGYKLNRNYNCYNCSEHCEDCEKDSNGEIICTQCEKYYVLNEDKKCVLCPPYCEKCSLQNGKFTCIECEKSKYYGSNYYVLDVNNNCIECQSIQSIGGPGCIKCRYNNNENRHECLQCLGNTTGYVNAIASNQDYAYIMNEYICKDNTDKKVEFLFGCLKANYDNVNNKYLCYSCKDDFIFIKNENKCLLPEEAKLTLNCCNAENIGTSEKPIYSCVDCKYVDNIKVHKFPNYDILDCINLHNCLEAKYLDEENTKIECIKCIDNNLEKVNGVCLDKCKNGYFLYIKKCYKCDDSSFYFGNKGCDSEYGCNFNLNNLELDCVKCKKGYYKYLNQCFACSLEDPNCGECFFDDSDSDENKKKFVCNKCIDKYELNNNLKCKPCEEQLDISIGCMICEENMNDFYYNKQCQYCREPEFFHTKEQKCFYCKARTNGGPACNRCKYDSNGKIICVDCPYDKILLNGKCYDIEEELGIGCERFEVNEAGNLYCLNCKDSYNKINGHCVYYKNYCEDIPNCIDLKCINNEDSTFKTECSECEKGYYLLNNQCLKINEAINCTFNNFIYNNQSKLIEDCKKLCNDDNYVIITHTTKDDNIKEIDLNSIKNYLSNDNIKNLLNDTIRYSCLNNNANKIKNLNKCTKANYLDKNETYECISCVSGYSLNNNTKMCEPKKNCETENIIIDSNSVESCIKCNEIDALVTTESGVKICETPYYPLLPELNDYYKTVPELEGCSEANVSTKYYYNDYYCTKCSYGYALFYSKFFERKICQNIYSEPISEKEFDSESKLNCIEYNNCTQNDYSINVFDAGNGNYFACDDKEVGMVGCIGKCTFSKYRNNVLQCEENKCKEGFIETKKGVCESCKVISPGCETCYYSYDYPNNFIGLKRNRRIVCSCDKDKYIEKDGNCFNCKDLGVENCEKCKDENNNYVCEQCEKGYFLENGICTLCDNNRIIFENQCIRCSERIEGCETCSVNKDKIKCKECKNGYIYDESGNECLNVLQDKKLQKLINCKQINSKKDYECTKCIDDYVLLWEKDSNIPTCVSINFIYTPNNDLNSNCQIFKNYRSLNQPKYMCEKCLNDSEIIKYTKIHHQMLDYYYCENTNKYKILKNCEEADMNIFYKDEVNINCTKCAYNYHRVYHTDTNSFFCRHNNSAETCVVKYCRKCRNYDNYFCEACFDTNYEINLISGACLKKMPKIPAITWKDIFRLQLNQNKKINEKDFYGPMLRILGLTRDQIPNGHAFLVFFVFKIKYSNGLRVLEEDKKIPTICEIEKEVDKAVDGINKVEYECIANITEYENEETDFSTNKLVNIEEDQNENIKVLRNSNLNEIVNENKIKTIKKYSSSFTLSNFLNTSLFTFDEIKNQTSDNLIFDFSLSGKLNKELNPLTIDFNLSVAEIKGKYANCKFEIKENKNANLDCYLNIEDYKDYKNLSFKTATVDFEEKSIFLDSIHEIYLFNNYSEKDKNKNKILIIICSIFGPIILIGIVILIIILIKKKKKKNKIIYKIANNTTNNEISKESSKVCEDTNKTDDMDMDIDIVPDKIEVGKKIPKYYEK